MTPLIPIAKPILKLSTQNILAWLVLAALAIFPFFSCDYILASVRDIMLLALFALSLDVFWGRTGILSFGHATFFGLGAYGMAITSTQLGLDAQWAGSIGLIAGIGLAVIVAASVGYFILFGGVRGAYFTIVTLALTIIASQIAIGWSNVTGGDSGLLGIPPFKIAGYVFDTAMSSYILAFLLLAACLLGSLYVLNGKLGRVLQAIQDDEMKMRTLGYRTSFILLMVFCASAAIASLAGAVYASSTGFVAPDQIALLLSTEVIIWVAVGGRGNLVGAVIGTFIVWQLQQKLSSFNASAWPIVIGTFFILMVLVFPKGLPDYILKIVASAKTGMRAK